jgi:hypothetical protein
MLARACTRLRPQASARTACCRIAHVKGLVLTVTAGLIIWIVLWALGAKGFDSFMLATLIIVVGASLKIIAGYLPGRHGD